MNAELRVYLYQQMYMVRQHLQGLNRRLVVLADLGNDLFQAFCHSFNQHLAPVLRTPHHMIVASILHIAVGTVILLHTDSIQR